MNLQQSIKHENFMFIKHTYTQGAKSKITTFLTRLYEFGTLQKSPVSSLVAFTQRDQAIFNGLLKQIFDLSLWPYDLPLDDTPIRSLVAIK